MALLGDYPRVRKSAKMFHYGLARQWEPGREPGRGPGARRQALEQASAGWIRQRNEHGVIHVQLDSCTWGRRMSNRQRLWQEPS